MYIHTHTDTDTDTALARRPAPAHHLNPKPNQTKTPKQIYRSYTEKHYHHDFVVYGCGFVQTALYVDFFYYYALSKYYGGTLSLPTFK